jgi:hypothetical protein
MPVMKTLLHVRFLNAQLAKTGRIASKELAKNVEKLLAPRMETHVNLTKANLLVM